MYTDKNGMTVYTSDLDNTQAPAKDLEGSELWAPHLGKEDEVLKHGWTHVKRADGTLHLAYLGKLTYLFRGDRGKGDMKGDGLNGSWHVLKE